MVLSVKQTTAYALRISDWSSDVCSSDLLSNVVALLTDPPPRRFVWRGQIYRVVAADGPERIHGEWWRNSREMWAVRDYFRVEADGGERVWLFRRGDDVDAPTGDLTLHIHGMFGFWRGLSTTQPGRASYRARIFRSV